MAVYKDSRYTKTAPYITNDTVALEVRERMKFNLDNATYYTVVQADTIDGIAYNLYGNSQLYWAILDANPKYLSELDIKAGDVLIIPALEEVIESNE